MPVSTAYQCRIIPCWTADFGRNPHSTKMIQSVYINVLYVLSVNLRERDIVKLGNAIKVILYIVKI